MSAQSLLPGPVEILQSLIRFDTTNPPGCEAACIAYIQSLLNCAGIETQVFARTPERPNLVARLPGQGQSPPLLLYGHVDVVTTEKQRWQVPPFEGRIQDGWLWGRGALDMKGGVAMFLAAVLRARAEGFIPPGDVIFTALADEEALGAYGARFMVEQHPEQFSGVRYALGEFGGFNLSMMGVTLYPIMVAEKQCCWMNATFRGQGGHGSMPLRGQAMAKAARALRLLDERPLPVHITPPVQLMIERIAAALPGGYGLALRSLLNPRLADPLLGLLGERGRLFFPLLHNTASPTMLQGSEKINVIPSEIQIGLDGRVLPGIPFETIQTELRDLLGDDFDLDVISAEPGPGAPDMHLFERLGGVLRSFDPAAVPIPYVMSGVTDARFFSQLGIQTYGFTPLKLPTDFNFIQTVHAADERVPVEALVFGEQAVYNALSVF